MNRRRFAATIGGAALSVLGGCLGGDSAPDEPEYDDWFGPTDNFDGFVDMTDVEEVVVFVGASERGFMFEHYRADDVPEADEPPYDAAAVTVSPETTVRWEWTGKGGQHNVAEREEQWTNPQGVTESDTNSWKRVFDAPGTHLYECWPHSSIGMRGGIFVDANG